MSDRLGSGRGHAHGREHRPSGCGNVVWAVCNIRNLVDASIRITFYTAVSVKPVTVIATLLPLLGYTYPIHYGNVFIPNPNPLSAHGAWD